MSDAYFVGVWHRFVRHRARLDVPCDGGITIVEIMIAIVLVATALVGVAGEVAADIKQQGLERTQAEALHLADAWLEAQEPATHADQTFTGIATQAAPGAITVNRISYNRAVTYQVCQPTYDPTSNQACSLAGISDSTLATTFATIKVTWRFAGKNHQLTLTRKLGDDAQHQDDINSQNPLSDCSGTGAANISATLEPPVPVNPPSPFGNATSGQSASNPLDMDSSFHPRSDVTFTLDHISGLTNANCIPLLWVDDSPGVHEIDMHTTNGGTSFTATITASQITRTALAPSFDSVVTSGSTPKTGFYALLPSGVSTVRSNAQPLYLDVAPSWAGTCTVSSVALSILGVINIAVGALQLVIGQNTRRLIATGNIICTTNNLNASPIDHVTATLQNPGSNPTTVALSSTNGFTWTGSLTGGLTGNGRAILASSGTSETFVFTFTRASDNRSLSQTVQIPLTPICVALVGPC